MQAFTILDSEVVPLDRANVDTDAIIPKQFMKSISRTGFGPYLFDEWRYLDHGELGIDCATRPLNPDFPLNQHRYRGAQVLLARENFGCGSSREHAVWALDGYGIRALIAPSFADIFYGNCLKNGILPVTLDAAEVDALFRAAQVRSRYVVRIDLTAQTVSTSEGITYGFSIDASRKDCLLRSLDEIDLTLQWADDIKSYEKQRLRDEPWIFGKPDHHTSNGGFSESQRTRAMKVIAECGGSLTLASQRLGISIPTLSRWRSAVADARVHR